MVKIDAIAERAKVFVEALDKGEDIEIFYDDFSEDIAYAYAKRAVDAGFNAIEYTTSQRILCTKKKFPQYFINVCELHALGACKKELNMFCKVFGFQVKVTEENILKALAHGFELGFIAEHDEYYELLSERGIASPKHYEENAAAIADAINEVIHRNGKLV